MRYRRLLVSNFRGVESKEVFFGEGVTVVAGPNESGKSSLREAIELLRDAKDSSSAARVRNVKPVHKDEAPAALLEMVTGPYTLTYRKQWLRSPSTELHVEKDGVPSHFTGAEAEQKFTKLLEETVDFGLLKELDVRQGTSLTQPNLANITALHQALGDSPQPESADTLMAAVEAEYLRYFTRGGQPSKEVKTAREKLAEVEAERSEVETRYLEVEALSARFQENRAVIQVVRKQLETAREKLEGALVREEQLWELQAQVQSHKSQNEDLEAQAMRLETQVRERAELSEKLGQVKAEAGALEQKITTNLGAQAEAKTHAERTRTAFRAAVDEHDEAAQVARTAEQALTTYRDAQELRDLMRRDERMESAFSQIEAAEEELAANPATEDLVAAVSQAHTAYEVANAKLLAAAPKVSVRALGQQPVSVDGGGVTQEVAFGEPLETEVPSTLQINVPGVVNVLVSGGTSLESLDESARAAKAALEDALRAVKATSVAHAQILGQKRQMAQNGLEQAKRAFAESSDGLSRDELKVLVAAATGRLGEAAQAGALDKILRQERADLEASARESRKTLDRLAKDLERGRAELERAQRAEEAASQEGARLQLAEQGLSAHRELLEEQLEARRREGADEALVHQRDALAAQRADLEARSTETEEKLNHLDAGKIMAEVANLQELVPSKEVELEEAKRQEVVLGTQLDERTAEGLYDRLQELLLQQEEARSVSRQLASRAASANLLWSTLSRHKAEAQAEYVAPLETALEELGRLVFGRNFGVQVGPELQIVSRTLDGVTVPFEALSAGTQEQLALLGRLAVARLVDSEQSAPVILDDTLGFADPQRLEDLNMVLNSVGKEAQVIVLTCQPERFGSVGGAKVVNLGS